VSSGLVDIGGGGEVSIGGGLCLSNPLIIFCCFKIEPLFQRPIFFTLSHSFCSRKLHMTILQVPHVSGQHICFGCDAQHHEKIQFFLTEIGH
jgi:hypothetical protein